MVAVLFAVFYMLGYLLRNSSEGTNNGGLNSCLNEYYSSKQKFTDEHSCIFNNLGSNPDSFKKITSFCEQAPSNPILLIKSDSPFGYEVIAKEKENERLRALPINVTVADYCFMTIAEKLLERDYQLGFLQKELGSENQTVLSVPIHLCKELGKTSSSSQKEQACYLYLLGTANIDTYVINADDKLKQSPYYTKWLSGLRELCQNLAEPKPTKCAVVPT
ncbi:MAG: hypothetical protein EPN86_05005 [Nanoarchaeota archaeon]|nr:MAG: hypothetical protein EPN86_05005 [Nanoarchaeota archaeon]